MLAFSFKLKKIGKHKNVLWQKVTKYWQALLYVLFVMAW